MSRQPLPDRERVLIIYPLRICRGSPPQMPSDNGMRLADLEPPLKDRLKKLLPDYVCGMNLLGRLQPGCEDCEEDN